MAWWIAIMVGLVTSTAAGSAPPRVQAATAGARIVTVRGVGFEPGTRHLVEVGAHQPLESKACTSAFARDVVANEAGQFTSRISISPTSGCSFACDTDQTPLVVTVSSSASSLEARSKPFACARRR